MHEEENQDFLQLILQRRPDLQDLILKPILARGGEVARRTRKTVVTVPHESSPLVLADPNAGAANVPNPSGPRKLSIKARIEGYAWVRPEGLPFQPKCNGAAQEPATAVTADAVDVAASQQQAAVPALPGDSIDACRAIENSVTSPELETPLSTATGDWQEGTDIGDKGCGDAANANRASSAASIEDIAPGPLSSTDGASTSLGEALESGAANTIDANVEPPAADSVASSAAATGQVADDADMSENAGAAVDSAASPASAPSPDPEKENLAGGSPPADTDVVNTEVAADTVASTAVDVPISSSASESSVASTDAQTDPVVDAPDAPEGYGTEAAADADRVSEAAAAAAATGSPLGSEVAADSAGPEAMAGLLDRRSTIVAIEGAPGTSSAPSPMPVPYAGGFRCSLSGNGRASSRGGCSSPNGFHSPSPEGLPAAPPDSPLMSRRMASPAFRDPPPRGHRSPIHRVMLKFDGPRAVTRSSATSIGSSSSAAGLAPSERGAAAAAAAEDGTYVLLLRGGIPVLCGPPPQQQAVRSPSGHPPPPPMSPPSASVHLQRLPSPDCLQLPQQQQQLLLRRSTQELQLLAKQHQQQQHQQCPEGPSAQEHRQKAPQAHQPLLPDPLCVTSFARGGGSDHSAHPVSRSVSKVAAAWTMVEETRRAPAQEAQPAPRARDPEPGRGGKLQPLSLSGQAAAQLSARLEQLLLKPQNRPRSSPEPLERSMLMSPPCMAQGPTSVTAPGGILACGYNSLANEWRLRPRAQSLPQIGWDAIAQGKQLRLPALPTPAAPTTTTSSAPSSLPLTAAGSKDDSANSRAVGRVDEQAGGGIGPGAGGGSEGSSAAPGGGSRSSPAVVVVPPRLLELPVRRRPPPLSPHGGLPRRGSPFGGGAGGGNLLGTHSSFHSRTERQQAATRFDAPSLAINAASDGGTGDARQRNSVSRGSAAPSAAEESGKSAGAAAAGYSDSGLPRGPGQSGPAVFSCRAKERAASRQTGSRVRPQPLRLFSSTDGGDEAQAEDRPQVGPGSSPAGAAVSRAPSRAAAGAAGAAVGVPSPPSVERGASRNLSVNARAIAVDASAPVLPSLSCNNSTHAVDGRRAKSTAHARFVVVPKKQDNGVAQGTDGCSAAQVQPQPPGGVGPPAGNDGREGAAATGADVACPTGLVATVLGAGRVTPDMRPYMRRKSGKATTSSPSLLTAALGSCSNYMVNGSSKANSLLPMLVNQASIRAASRAGSGAAASLPVVAVSSPRAG